jgi:hypothetical protein
MELVDEAQGIIVEEIHQGVIHWVLVCGVMVGPLSKFLIQQINNAFCPGIRNVLLVFFDPVEKKVKDVVKSGLIPTALDKVGPQDKAEFDGVGRVDKSEVACGIDHFAGGNPEVKGPAAGGKSG